MRTTRTLTFCTGGLLLFTLVAGAILSSTTTHADDTVIDNINISVPVSCNINSTIDEEHSALVYNGTYEDEIGTTTFQVFCNDDSGFSIYAIGYSNLEFGNTKMLAAVAGELAPTYDIVTGTATSGSTSNWAMKLTPVAGTYAPTIGSDTNGSFSSYHIIPSTYTKVATFASTTDVTIGSKLQTTYAVLVSPTQPAGTYNGKVKYTLVHPASEAPLQPQDCTANKICYWPNANGVVDNMGDRSITASTTSTTLWPTNFKRSGYGFAGWSDAYDYKVNEGSSSNPNAHIYGPMEDITFTAGQYSADGLSLYAVWVKSQDNLQGWTCPNNTVMPIGTVTALTDTRDNDTYAVAKLADGKCWMIENLRLADKTSNNVAIELNSTNTNNPLLPLTNTWYFSDSNQIAKTTSNSLSASQNPTQGAWCVASSANCYDQSMLFAGNTTSPISNMTALDTNTAIYSYGNYYNWYSATAGNGKYSTSTYYDNAQGDICPNGWHLPTGSPNEEFDTLNNDANSGSTSDSSSLRAFPNNFLYSGQSINGSVNNRSSLGFYWSPTINNRDYVYGFVLSSSSVVPGTFIYYKYNGFSVRCLDGSS